MAVWKGTMHFACGLYGWSECFYTQTDSPVEAFARLQQLGDARARMLGQPALLTRIVLSLPGNWRVTISGGVRHDPLPSRSMLPIKGLMVRLKAKDPAGTKHYARAQLFRGIPEDFFGPIVSGQQTYNPNGFTELQAFLAILSNGQWMLSCGDKKLPWHPIGLVAVGGIGDSDPTGDGIPLDEQAPGGAIITCYLDDNAELPALDPATGRAAYASLRNVRWTPQRAFAQAEAGGKHSVLRSGPGFVQLQGGKVPPGEYRGGGWIQTRQTLLAPIIAAEPGLLATRKTGQPVYRELQSRTMPGLDATVPFDVFSLPLPNVPLNWQWPVKTTLNDAQEVALYVFDGYAQSHNGERYAITIAPVTDDPKTWLVTLLGTQLDFTAPNGIQAALYAALGIQDRYTRAILRAMETVIPPGSRVHLAGHSLGGMEAQNIILAIPPALYRFPVCVTFGSPITQPAMGGTTYSMFKISGDRIPEIPTPHTIDGSRPFLYPTTILLPPITNAFDLEGSHNGYPRDTELQLYDVDGVRRGARKWPLGLRRFFRADGTEIE